mgnify:CR=1 FL=1
MELTKEVIDHLAENAVILEGLNDCVVGVINTCREQGILLYDTTKIIEKLERDMSHEEALEYFAYNIRGAYFGEGSPVFLDFNVNEGDVVYGKI